MTGEPDSKPGRRPPIIELKATEIDNPAAGHNGDAAAPAGASTAADQASAAPGEAAPAAPQEQAAPDPGHRPLRYAAIALVGAVIVAALGAGLWYAGVLPSSVPAPAPATETAPAPAGPIAATVPAAAKPDTTDDAVAARLDKIEQAIKAQRQDATTLSPALADRLASAEAATKALGASVAALAGRVDTIAAASQSAAKQADAAAAAADAAKNTADSAAATATKSAATVERADQTQVQRSDLEALGNRIAALESAIKNLSEKQASEASAANDRPARLTVAAESLRAAVERGASYQAELTAVQSLGADQNALAPLQAFAPSGVPSAAALGRELAALMPALDRDADVKSRDESFLDRLEAHAQQLVRVTPVEAPVGDDPGAVLTRLEIDAAHADIPAALRDIAALPDAAKPLAADWVAKAQAREAALAAGRQIAADALAALARPGVP